MNIKLFCFLSILISLTGLSLSGDDGNYPIDANGNRYSCGKLGENEFCLKVCKLHGVKRGYCYFFKCYCELLKDKDIQFFDAYKTYCKNSRI
uniref:Lipolysis-activating peptide 1-alpha chain n=1 Tax=Lychas mucronatus TaxID=172552 RepID=LVPAH_LYCMC|nr:RecName: Full=Lipolysis-activating peptide 1-alpha chain; Short=LVP1-alpha; AltName: Full=Neurotoxin LmNaTx7; Flags: Precursor [Lychas mucronatus]ABX76755.1 neurotoxin LmNaTx7 precursor [Lychas mucronatus]